jgi:hypothetical protein
MIHTLSTYHEKNKIQRPSRGGEFGLIAFFLERLAEEK